MRVPRKPYNENECVKRGVYNLEIVKRLYIHWYNSNK
jgi:hypothetical protein